MKHRNGNRGFTLLELLVVIGIIAILVAVIIPNLLGARERARDATKKATFHEMKNALRLFYNDYNTYPASDASHEHMMGCGPSHNALCSENGCFYAGSANCSDAAATVYMKSIPDLNGPAASGIDYNYYMNSATGESFCLTTTLANTADPDLAASQARCTTQGSCTAAQCSAANSNYCVCED